MGNLRKVTKTVRGKHGTVRRSYWVRAVEPTRRFLKHHGPTAAKAVGLAALTVTSALLAKRHGDSARTGFAAFRRGSGSQLAGKLVSAVGDKLVSHAGESVGRKAGGYVGRKVGGRRGRALGELVGETVGGVTASHFADRHVERASKLAAKRVRESGQRRQNGKFVRY